MTGRRRRAVVAATIGLFAAVGLILLAWRDLRAVRARLTEARALLVQAGDQVRAVPTAERRVAAARDLERALDLLTSARQRAEGSPVLSLARLVPGPAGQRAGLLVLIDDVTTAATAGQRLLGSADALVDAAAVTQGAVPLDVLSRLRLEVDVAARSIGSVARAGAGLWGPLGDARREFDATARSSARRLRGVAEAMDVSRRLLGDEGPRRYLLALQNNAEMRDQGMVLAYAVTGAEAGRLVFERAGGSVGDLELNRPAPTPLPPGTEAVFGFMAPTHDWHSVNATADFAFSGRAMADMYQQATGQPVDGVIALDVPGLAALLRVLGPVTVEGFSEPVGADNAARLLLHDQYQGLAPESDQAERRARQAEVAGQIVDRLAGGSYDVLALGREMAQGAEGGHLRMWSATPAEEEVLERIGLGGGPARVQPERTFHLAVQNRTSSKLDYFVHARVRQEVRLGQGSSLVVRTTVAIENGAPAGASPSYQLGHADGSRPPGDYSAWVLLWAPAGSLPEGVVESGLNLTDHVVEVAAGERREVVFETTLPRGVRDGRLALRLVPQPRLRPSELEVRIEGPGWKSGQPRSWQGPWDRTHNLSWAAL